VFTPAREHATKALLAQIPQNPWAAIRAFAALEELADPVEQRLVFSLALAGLARQPGIVAATTDTHNSAKRRDRKPSRMPLDELVSHSDARARL